MPKLKLGHVVAIMCGILLVMIIMIYLAAAVWWLSGAKGLV